MSTDCYAENYKSQKLSQLLNSHEWADCTFVVEDLKIPAHRLILAYNSPIFAAMLFGKMSSSEIVISDIKADDFRDMLQYVYTDYVQIKSVVHAWSLVYVSQKYFLNSLLRKCIEYIKGNLGINTLMMSYEYAQLYEIESIMKLCYNDITVQMSNIFLYSYYHMKKETLCELLTYRFMRNYQENDVIMGIVNWAESECELQNLPVSTENVLQILNESGLLMHLQQMTLSPLGDEVRTESFELLYRMSERVYSMLAKTYPQVDECSLVIIKPSVQICQFRQNYKVARKLIFMGSINISTVLNVNRECLISGFAVQTQHSSTATYLGEIRVKVLDTRSETCLFETARSNERFHSDEALVFNFHRPVVFYPTVLYQVIITHVQDSRQEGQILLHYFSSKLRAHYNTTFECFNEPEGSVLAGIISYPL